MNSISRGVVALLAGAAFLSACTQSESHPVPHPPPAPVHVPTNKTSSDNAAIKGLGLGGLNSLFTMPDRHHPQWPACKLILQTFVGILDNNSMTGHGATAILFNKGQRSAIMTAPNATGNSVTEMVTASGGVHLMAVNPASHPTGRFLDADTVVWNAKTQLGKAYGHVHYRDTKSGMVGTAPVLYFNSGLKKISNAPLPPGS